MTTQDTNHDTAAGEVLQEQVVATDHSLLALASTFVICMYISTYLHSVRMKLVMKCTRKLDKLLLRLI